MSFWSAASTAWRIGTTYRHAYESARDVILAGGSIAEAVDIFASLTPDEFDDKLAEELTRGLELGIGYAQNAALALGRIAATIETRGPEVLSAVNRLATQVRTRTEDAERLAFRASLRADDVRALAVGAGVLATRLALRLEKLRGSP